MFGPPESSIEESSYEFALVDDSGTLIAVPYASYTPSYGVGTTNLEIFKGLTYRLPYGTHYVYFRADQYNYYLAYSSSLTLSGSTFTGTGVTLVNYNTYYTTGGQPTFSTQTQSTFTLNAGNYLVYSDLGSYPELANNEVIYYAQTTVIGLGVLTLLYILSRIRTSLRL